MSALIELEQAARLHRAEERWLAQCADRLRRAATPRPPDPTGGEQEAVR